MNDQKEDKMERIRQIMAEKGIQVWLLVCLGVVGFLYVASLTLLTARVLVA